MVIRNKENLFLRVLGITNDLEDRDYNEDEVRIVINKVVEDYFQKTKSSDLNTFAHETEQLIQSMKKGYVLSNPDNLEEKIIIDFEDKEQTQLFNQIYTSLKDEEKIRIFLNEISENSKVLNSDIIDFYAKEAEKFIEKDIINENKKITDQIALINYLEANNNRKDEELDKLIEYIDYELREKTNEEQLKIIENTYKNLNSTNQVLFGFKILRNEKNFSSDIIKNIKDKINNFSEEQLSTIALENIVKEFSKRFEEASEKDVEFIFNDLNEIIENGYEISDITIKLNSDEESIKELFSQIYYKIDTEEKRNWFVEQTNKYRNIFDEKASEVKEENKEEEKSKTETTEEPKKEENPKIKTSDGIKTNPVNGEIKIEPKEGKAITQYKKDTEDLKKQLEEKEAKLSKLGNVEIDAETEKLIEDLNNNLKSATREKDFWESKKQKFLEENPNYKDFEDKNKEFEELERIINGIDNKIVQTKNDIEKIKTETTKKDVITITEEEKNKLIAENLFNEEFASAFDLEYYTNKLADKTREKESLTEIINQNINESAQLKEEIEQLKQALAVDSLDLNQRLGFQLKIKEKETRLADINNNIENSQNAINEIDKEIADLNTIIDNKDDFEFIFNKLTEDLTKELEQNKETVRKLEEQKQEKINEIEKIKSNVVRLEKEYEELNKFYNIAKNDPNFNNEQLEKFKKTIQNKGIELQLEKNLLVEEEKKLANIENEITELNGLINDINNEINIRTDYLDIVNDINGLINKKVSDEDIENIKEKINNSNLDSEIKEDLQNKLNKTSKVKATEPKKEEIPEADLAEIDKLKKTIAEREANIREYYDILKDIKEIEKAIQSGKTPDDEELSKKITSVKERINKLPESLKQELEDYLKAAMTMKIVNVEKQPKKWQKWAWGIAGFALAAGVVAFTPISGVAIGITASALNIGVTALHKHLTKKENDITKIEKPNEKQKNAISKFKAMIKDENKIKNIQWFLTGSVLGSIAGGLVDGYIGLDDGPRIDTVTDTTGTVDPVQPDPYSEIRIGDNASNLDLTKGYDTSNWAANNVNAESLNQTIMQDGNSIIDSVGIVRDGSTHVIETTGKSIAEIAQQYGVSPEEVVLNITNQHGAPRAWVDAAEAVGKVMR